MITAGTETSQLFECRGCGEIAAITAALSTTTPGVTLTGLAVASKVCDCGHVTNTVVRFGDR